MIDDMEHNWVKRNKAICPFVCSRCGALSGSNEAVNYCKAALPEGTSGKDLHKIFIKSDREKKFPRLKGGLNGYVQMVLKLNPTPNERFIETSIEEIFATLISQKVDSVLILGNGNSVKMDVVDLSIVHNTKEKP